MVYENVLVVKSVHNSEDSLRKVSEILIKKLREFNCSTGDLVFLCNMKLISFFFANSQSHEKNFVFMLFALRVFGT